MLPLEEPSVGIKALKRAIKLRVGSVKRTKKKVPNGIRDSAVFKNRVGLRSQDGRL